MLSVIKIISYPILQIASSLFLPSFLLNSFLLSSFLSCLSILPLSASHNSSSLCKPFSRTHTTTPFSNNSYCSMINLNNWSSQSKYLILSLLSSPLLSSPLLSSPTLFYSILSSSILSYPLLSYLIYPILSYPLISSHILSSSLLFYPLLFYSILSYPILPRLENTVLVL